MDTSAVEQTDTWILANGTWQQHDVAGPSRSGHAIAYDAKHDQLVLFAGANYVAATSKTWTWTAAQGWQELTLVLFPPARVDNGAAYDSRREEIVIAGGVGIVKFDAWRWDGTWHRLEDVLEPDTPDQAASLAYDELHACMVLVNVSGAWRMQWDSTIPDELCFPGVDADSDGKRGCDDPDCAVVCSDCGNGTCDPVESCRTCAGDCGACTARCGDTFCDAPETAATCPGDCP